MSYLNNLTLRMAQGAAGLPQKMRSRHAAYIHARQRDDGGFPGRQGYGDPYYTSLGLRALALLEELDGQTASRAASFLQGRLGKPLPSIDFLSLVTAGVLLETAVGVDVFAQAGRDRRQSVIDFTERFRRDDGGYAKTDRGATSTYHTFLVILCKQMVGAPLEDVPGVIQLIRSRQRDDGGFVELDPIPDGGANPTAAAVGLLRCLDALDEATASSAAAFLAGMQNEEGGLRANARLPVADLLSTFTGLVALSDVGAVSAVDAAGMRRYVASLERPEGGFRGGVWDDASDVEYTFYGLGALGLLDA